MSTQLSLEQQMRECRKLFFKEIPTRAAGEDISTFLEFWHTFYVSQDISGQDLADVFFDDFENFTVGKFDKTDKDYKRSLKKLLRQRDVYNSYGRGRDSFSKQLPDLVATG